MVDKSYAHDDPRLVAYLADVYRPEDPLLARTRRRSREAGLPEIQVGPHDGRHLSVFAAAAGVRRAVEIGTLGGYSAVCLLRGMVSDGFLHCVELEADYARVARETLAEAGYSSRARVHVGSALDVLPTLESEGPFDLVFADADKAGYPQYLDWAARHLRPGGLFLADNAFLFGELLDEPTGANAAAIRGMRAMHERLAQSGEFLGTVLPTGEGLALAVRRP